MGLADIGTARIQAQFRPEPETDSNGEDGPYRQALLVGTTLLGKHSIAETRELAALVDFQAHATDELVAKHQPVPAQAADALRRWTVWRTNWQKTRDRALLDLKLLSFASPLTPEYVVPSEAQYQKLKCAINVSCDESHTDPRDMREVINAVEKALDQESDLSGFRARFPEQSNVPDVDSPLDQQARSVTDTAVKKLEALRDKVMPPPKPFTVPWWVYALGVTVVGGIGYSFWKVHTRIQESRARDALAAASRDPLEGITLPPHMTPILNEPADPVQP